MQRRPPLAPAATQDQQPETPRAEKPTKDAVDMEKAAAQEHKVVPARRWRELLRLRKEHASSTSSSAMDTKPLRRLLRRGNTRRTRSRCAASTDTGRSRRSRSHPSFLVLSTGLLFGQCVVIRIQFNTCSLQDPCLCVNYLCGPAAFFLILYTLLPAH